MTTPGYRTRAERNALELQTPTANRAEQDARRIRRDADSDDPRDSLATIAAALGHGGVQVEETVARTRWFSWCQCGWVSTTRNTETDATGAAVHHLRLVLKDWRRAGLPLAATAPAPPPNWDLVGRRHAHWALKRAAEKKSPTPSRGVSHSDTPRMATG